jgi:hypothetical protein
MVNYNKLTPPKENEVVYIGNDSNYGIILKKTPLLVYNEIENLAQNLIKNKFNGVEYNHLLAGHINREYKLDPTPIIKNYIKELVKIHNEQFKYYKLLLRQFYDPPSITLKELWINYQSKHEYNPPHIHSGIFSFVFWHKIPYFLKNEEKYGPGKYKSGSDNYNGKFSFLHPEYQVNSRIAEIILPVDKEWEGVVSIFPSNLHHCVYPFYSSDDYRVTIAGNVYFESK